MLKKVILVTGGSRGIGREIVNVLAKEGNCVIANYHKSESKALELQKELKEEGHEIDIFQCDVSQREAVKKMMGFVVKKYGKIDVLVNNAGIDDEKMFIDITDEDWNTMMQNNLYSVFCCTQEAIKYMLHQMCGCVINISSIYGTSGGSCDVHYSTAKAGIIGMTKALAKEFGLSHIRVNSIAPGAILTDMTANILEEDWTEVKKEIPLGRIGKTMDIARCVKWLVEDEYTTGQVIEVNGRLAYVKNRDFLWSLFLYIGFLFFSFIISRN